MKKLILTIAISVLILGAHAQVTPNKTYNYSASVVKLETLGYKYYLMDVPNGECRLYNQDHSLFKTINCNIPNGFYLSDIKFISKHIFDTDAEVELLCTYYKYYTSQAYYEYNSKIINDDGTQILALDGALYNYINKTDEDTYKLFSYSYDYSTFPEKVWTNIYNLPGTAVATQYLNEKSAEILLNMFPNPASEKVNIAYQLPENSNTGNLYLFDNNGRVVNKFVVDGHTDHLEINISEYKSGIYHYFIEHGNTKTPSKKLVVR